MNMVFKFSAKILLNSLILFFTPAYIPGFVITYNPPSIVGAAILLTLLNLIVRPFLKIITTPLIWITFGLFTIVINIAILWMLDIVLEGLEIQTFSALFWVSTIIAIINSLL